MKTTKADCSMEHAHTTHISPICRPPFRINSPSKQMLFTNAFHTAKHNTGVCTSCGTKSLKLDMIASDFDSSKYKKVPVINTTTPSATPM